MNTMVKIVMAMAAMAWAVNSMAQDATGQDSVAVEWGDTLQLQDVEVVTMRQLGRCCVFR